MPISKVFDDIIKSENDDRQYRGFVLTNDLKVLLISDPKTDISSAALEVNVGSMSEPKDHSRIGSLSRTHAVYGQQKGIENAF